MVRINGPKTEWFSRDLTLCAQPGISSIVLPKAEQAKPRKIQVS